MRVVVAHVVDANLLELFVCDRTATGGLVLHCFRIVDVAAEPDLLEDEKQRLVEKLVERTVELVDALNRNAIFGAVNAR